jgi:hypothetical protein
MPNLSVQGIAYHFKPGPPALHHAVFAFEAQRQAQVHQFQHGYVFHRIAGDVLQQLEAFSPPKVSL